MIAAPGTPLGSDNVGIVPHTPAAKEEGQAPPVPTVEETARLEASAQNEEPYEGNALPQFEEPTSLDSEGTLSSNSSDMSSDASPDADTEISSQKEQILERLM